MLTLTVRTLFSIKYKHVRFSVPIGMSVISLCGVPYGLAQKSHELARDGKALYSITLAQDAMPAERTAAGQLQKYLNEVTGAEFVIYEEQDVPGTGAQIFIGAGNRVREILPDEDWAGLGEDGILIKSSGQDLVLAGGRPRGTLYAVFQFLEDQIGCRWWTPYSSSIPRIANLAVPVQDLRYVPVFSYREHFTTFTREDAEFATKLRENGHYQPQNEAWGGHYEILGFVHTFSELLPPEVYFAEHPEWYTDPARGDLPGTRESAMPEAQQTQLCLTNPEVLEALTKKALEWIRANPNAGYISISQNDTFAACQCADCQSVVAREGAESGVILQFVNAVAEEIGRHYPHFLVETLAYQHTELPPRTVRPAENVIIRLALATAEFGHPIDSEWNAASRDKVIAWADISHQLFIWSYATNFRRTMFPHPNWEGLADDLQFFAANKVKGVFIQGDCYTGNVGDFTELRAWLMGQLLWNPFLDQRALVAEFLDGYYGPAAPYLQGYLDLVTGSFLAQNRGLNSNNLDFSFLTLEVVNRAEELFDEASAAVAGDSELEARVRKARLSLTIARIARDRALRAQAAERGVPYPSKEEVEGQLDQWVEAVKEFGARLWGENVTIEMGVADLRRTDWPVEVELPAFAQGVSRREVIDFQPEMLTLALKGSLTTVEEDEDASGAKAVAMGTHSRAWLVQAHLGQHLEEAGQEWRVYVVAKTVGNPADVREGIAIDGGVYDDSFMQHVSRFKVETKDLSEDGYRTVDLGVHRLAPTMMIWFSPGDREVADKIYFDRVLLIREAVAKKLEM